MRVDKSPVQEDIVPRSVVYGVRSLIEPNATDFISKVLILKIFPLYRFEPSVW